VRSYLVSVIVARVEIRGTVLATETALGLVFDPRYRDFPFAPFTGPVGTARFNVASKRSGEGFCGGSEPCTQLS
jgi:hypothetical protein